MNLFFPSTLEKNIVFETIQHLLNENDFDITSLDKTRPWGGFFVIKEEQAGSFIKKFFQNIDEKDISTGHKISPKILIVQPGKKLSWQYHFRRAELWKVIGGEVGIVRSETDEENKMEKYGEGSIIKLDQGERHRLIGLDMWGIVAEIWQHTDANHPSNEEDIIRLQDDYGR